MINVESPCRGILYFLLPRIWVEYIMGVVTALCGLWHFHLTDNRIVVRGGDAIVHAEVVRHYILCAQHVVYAHPHAVSREGVSHSARRGLIAVGELRCYGMVCSNHPKTAVIQRRNLTIEIANFFFAPHLRDFL